MEQVLVEYEAAHDELKRIVETIPDEKWHGEMTYPWNERGTIEDLIKVMMAHETVDHCHLVIRATA